MKPEFIEPTWQGRAKLAALWLLIIAGFLTFEALMPAFEQFLQGLPKCALLSLMRSSVLVFLVMVLGLITMLGWEGYRLLHHRQWPHPRAWVLWRTRIRRGTGVLTVGYTLCGLAIGLLAGYAYLLLSQWHQFHPFFFGTCTPS